MSRSGNIETRLDRLVKRKVELLSIQKTLIDKFNYTLTRKGLDGLNEHSRLSCKNLEVAIIVSKSPGYFEYHQPSEEVKKVERSKLLNQLASKIKQVQQDIDQVDVEVRDIKKEEQRQEPVVLTTTDQWFRLYGTPKGYDLSTHHFRESDMTPKGYLSAMVPTSRIYGGSSHHPAFKSQAIVLKRGRLTR